MPRRSGCQSQFEDFLTEDGQRQVKDAGLELAAREATELPVAQLGVHGVGLIFLDHRLFWLFAALIVLGAATEMGPADWLPTAVKSLAGESDAVTAAGLSFALFSSLMAAGRFLTAALGARIGTRRLITGSALLSALCLTGVALPLPALPRIGCLCLLGLGVACFWPTLMAAAGDRFPQAGASMFSVLSVTGSLGCAIVPVLVGFLAGPLGGVTPALGLLAVLPLLLLVLSLGLPRPPAKP